MIEYITNTVTQGMIDLFLEHTDYSNEYTIFLSMCSVVSNSTLLYYDKDEVVGFVTYFVLSSDVGFITAIHKDNKFTKSMIKHIVHYVTTNRDKTIIIKSDSNNKLLRRLVDKYEGVWKDNYMVFKAKEIEQ